MYLHIMKRNFVKISVLLVFIWIIHILQYLCLFNPSNFSTTQDNSIFSIFTGVFIHGSFRHISSNTASLLVTLPLLLNFYKKDSTVLILLGLFIPGAFVYILGLNVIGISGLCYALIWFLIFSGLHQDNLLKFIISIVLVALMGNSLLGLTPEVGYRISWQAHLGGFIVAVSLVIKNLITQKRKTKIL